MRQLLILVALLLAPVLVEATTYYAAPSGSGAASCVDAGANVCNLVQAEAVAATGDTVQAACGTYDQGATTLTINVNITIAPVTAGCAIITGTHATSIVTLTAANDANVLTFGAFNVQSTGGANASTMIISNVAYDQTVVLSGTIISVGGTARHLADQWTRGTVKLIGVTMTGTIGTQAGYYGLVTPSSAKKVSITGSTFTLTGSASGTAAIRLERNATNATSYWVYVASNTFTLTSASTATVYGVRLNRIGPGTNLDGLTGQPPIVELNTMTITDVAASNAAYGIVGGSSDATAVADNAIFRDNTITVNSAISGCLATYTDGTTANFAANVRITKNTCRQLYYDGVATAHNIYAGRSTGNYVAGNTSIGGAVGIISSIGTGTVITGNLIIGATYAPLFAKGNTSATFANNTVIIDDTLYGAKFGGYGCLGAAVQGATNNAATTFQNNSCYVISGTGWRQVVVDASQVATFDNNNYYSIPALTTPWSYQGTTYASVGLWNAAATVGTDLNVDPLFLSATDYRLALTSPLRRTGIWWSNACSDMRGYPCFPGQIHIGAYQDGSGDQASARTVR